MERCKIPTKALIKFEVDFIAPTSSKTLKPIVTGYLGAIAVPIPLPEDEIDACKNIIVTDKHKQGCPIIAGEFYTYNVSFIFESFPASNMNVDVQMALSGDMGTSICLRFSARI